MEVKELPILFSTDMVQAILAGRKTMTRRTTNLDVINNNIKAPYWQGAFAHEIFSQDEKTFVLFKREGKRGDDCFKFPYGNIGDLLWVRETWTNGPTGQAFYETGLPVFYKGDFDKKMLENWAYSNESWKPSIHMRKEHARIWLEITGIRVERLTDISELDAMKEGLKVINRNGKPGDDLYLDYNNPYLGGFLSAYHSFRSLWDKINGKESFDVNPWVWVVDFKVLSTTGRPA